MAAATAGVRSVHVNRVPITVQVQNNSRVPGGTNTVQSQAPPIPVRRMQSLPDRTVSQQSQLDDILNELLADPLFVDGSRTYEFANEVRCCLFP